MKGIQAPSDRISSVDMMRFIAAYGVVVMHATIQGNSSSASLFQNLFIFAVPFFLAASFFFSKIPLSPPPSFSALRGRLWVLLLPYVFWSITYLTFRSAKYAAKDEPDRIRELFFGDPLALIFGGAAAVQLYFLPLLIIGVCLQHLLAPFLCLRNKLFLWAALIIALAIGYGSQTGFIYLPKGSPHTALEAVTITVGYIARYAIRCAPYIFVAALFKLQLERGFRSSRQKTAALLLFPFWIYVMHTPLRWLPGSLWEIFIGFYPLFLALALGDWFKPSLFWKRLGLYAFGIYLSHHLIVEALEFLEGKLFHSHTFTGSLPAFALFTLAALGITVLLVGAIDRWTPRLRPVFGLR